MQYKNIDPGIYVLENLHQLNRQSIKTLLQTKQAENQPCFVVFPHEWQNKSAQILSHVNSYYNYNIKKYHARKCETKLIEKSTLRSFCDTYHIQGSNNLSIIAWGIFYKGEMLGVLSLGRHNRNYDNKEIILDRLCFQSNMRIVGGAGKLFAVAKKWAIENHFKRIISFSDNRWSVGNVYRYLGFFLDKEMSIDYFYVKQDDYNEFHSKQSQKKDNVNCPENMTEKEWATERGLLQVWDGGKRRWVIDLRKDKKIKNPYTSRRNGYYHSLKAGTIYYDSGYELYTAIKLDEDDNVLTYSNQIPFKIDGRNRKIDYLVTLKTGKVKIIEVKPERRIETCKQQIEDNKKFAEKNGWDFEVWCEKEMGFKNDYEMTKWIDDYMSKNKSLDFVQIRKDKNKEKAKKHYQKVVAPKKIEIWCEYCQENHYPLKYTYDKNIQRNGTYICERMGGSIAGKKPKTHLRKENPYAQYGKKQCTGKQSCNRVLPFAEFSPDNSRRDGYSSQCKECRAKKYKEKYRNKNK